MDNLNELITVIDDDGNEHTFEELDRIETEDGQKYIAMIPADDEDSEDGELIILKVIESENETVLEPIEDDNEFDEIAAEFQERLSEFFDFE